MRVGVMADTHDRVPAVRELLAKVTEKGATMVLHAGDYCSPFSLKPFKEAETPLIGVYGRNDGDRESLEATASQGFGAELFESPHSFELSGRKLLLVHDIGDVNKRSIAAHDFVIHGCSHRIEQTKRGKTLLLNPGEACGWITGTCSAAVLDLETGQVEIITL